MKTSSSCGLSLLHPKALFLWIRKCKTMCSLTSARTLVLSVTPPLACWYRSLAWWRKAACYLGFAGFFFQLFSKTDWRAWYEATQGCNRADTVSVLALEACECSVYLAELSLSTAVLLDQMLQLVVDVFLPAAHLLQRLANVLLQFVQVALQK